MMHRSACLASTLALSLLAASSAAAQDDQRSHSSGLFLSYGAQQNVISRMPGAASTSNQHVSGTGVVLGYGFSREWSLYGQSGVGDFLTGGGNTTGAGYLELGARRHFMTESSVFVPFVQAGLSSRPLSEDIFSTYYGKNVSVMSSRLLPAVGAGFNLHIAAPWALSASASWSAGKFDHVSSGSASSVSSSYGITSPVLHIGIVSFLGYWM